jgi:DNA-binding transcriptional LysR family regulator
MWFAAELSVFAKVVDLGSFSAAARTLGVPKVAVSRLIQALEKRVGTPLLTRTTRRIALTPAGRALLPYSAAIAAQTEAARRALAPLMSQPRALRVLADPAYGRLLLGPLVPRFLERYPDIPLEVDTAGILPADPDGPWDVLIQNGPPTQEGLVGTPLGAPPVILCATPGYLAKHAAPQQPEDLAAHSLLIASAEAGELRLQHGERRAALRVAPRLLVNDPALIHAATAAGAGIGVLPEFLCRQGLALGKLTRVLPGWQVADLLWLHAVTDLRRAAQTPVRSLVEFLVANMVPALSHSG